jgi:hypothetical protein
VVCTPQQIFIITDYDGGLCSGSELAKTAARW